MKKMAKDFETEISDKMFRASDNFDGIIKKAGFDLESDKKLAQHPIAIVRESEYIILSDENNKPNEDYTKSCKSEYEEELPIEEFNLSLDEYEEESAIEQPSPSAAQYKEELPTEDSTPSLAKDSINIKLFTLSNCPWCHKAKDILKAHNVNYEEIEIDKSSGAQQAFFDFMVVNNSDQYVPQFAVNDSFCGYFSELNKCLSQSDDLSNCCPRQNEDFIATALVV